MDSAIARVPVTIQFADIDGTPREFDVRRFSVLETLQVRAFMDRIITAYQVPDDEALRAQYGLLVIATVAARQSDAERTFDEVANWFDPASEEHAQVLLRIASTALPAPEGGRGNADKPEADATSG